MTTELILAGTQAASGPCSQSKEPVNPGSPEPYTLTVSATTRFTGISRSEIYRLLALGRLDAVKAGRRTLITMESIKRLMTQLPRAIFG